MTQTTKSGNVEIVQSGEVTSEFPKGKENYCPTCYFDDDKVILRSECPCNRPTSSKRGRR